MKLCGRIAKIIQKRNKKETTEKTNVDKGNICEGTDITMESIISWTMRKICYAAKYLAKYGRNIVIMNNLWRLRKTFLNKGSLYLLSDFPGSGYAIIPGYTNLTWETTRPAVEIDYAS